MYIPTKRLIEIINDPNTTDAEKIGTLQTILKTKKVPKKSEAVVPLITIEKKEVKITF